MTRSEHKTKLLRSVLRRALTSGGVLVALGCWSTGSDGEARASCERACKKLHDCGLSVSDEEQAECIKGCRDEASTSAIQCILNVVDCDESVLKDCLGEGEEEPQEEPEGCGDCDDGNSCTVDACAGTVCQHDPVEDALTTHCPSSYTADACLEGELIEVSCPAVCVASGYDATSPCVEGAGCGCVDTGLGTACTPGDPGGCYSNNELFLCTEGSELGLESNFWLAWNCATLCREGGYDFSVGCSDTPRGGTCYCESCKESGDPCEVGDCCRDGECTWVDQVGAICVSFGACPAECQNGAGSCCRGNYCGGDCIGSPCCT